jgi:hypothetical protein
VLTGWTFPSGAFKSYGGFMASKVIEADSGIFTLGSK